MFDLSGKRALVTGSTQGIGKAIAAALRAHGAGVCIHCSRDEKKAAAVAASLGCERWTVGDLDDPSCANRLLETVGPMDIVVANASVQIRKPWDAITTEEFDLQIRVNFQSTLSLMQTFIPPMQKNHWGRFLTIGSVQQYRPHSHMAVYAASKCAIQSLVQNIARQVAADGVTVNSLLPGVILTPRNDEALSDPVYAAAVLRSIPAGYAGDPADCAVAALLLCSPEGRYITGTALTVDGGMSLH